MTNKYNVMVTYAGEGNFTFKLRKIGDVEISASKPVYIYNADVDTINNLRVLKRLLINIHIGAKPTGAFRVFNMDDYEIPQNVQIRQNTKVVKEPISNSEISNILSGSAPEATTTPEPEEKPKAKSKDEGKKDTEEKPKRTRKSTKKK